jgi:hypothetical protein
MTQLPPEKNLGSYPLRLMAGGVQGQSGKKCPTLQSGKSSVQGLCQ